MSRSTSVRTALTVAENLLERGVVGFEPTTGGLTHAVTGIAALDDGSRVFVKAGLDEHSRRQVATEISNLEWLRGPFLPEVIATSTDPPVLILEDLSAGHWPEPYPADLGRLEAALAELRDMSVPGRVELPSVDPPGAEVLDGLESDAPVAVPAAATWVTSHAGAIRAAVASIDDERVLVHSDLWYSNICFLPERVVIVDWSHAGLGSPWFDASTVSIDLIIEGRPPLSMEDACGWAAAHTAWVVWALAKGAGPGISDPEAWTKDNLELFDGTAWWLAHELGIEPPPRLTDRDVGW